MTDIQYLGLVLSEETTHQQDEILPHSKRIGTTAMHAQLESRSTDCAEIPLLWNSVTRSFLNRQ